MTKLFLTGATGYIGGDALHAIKTAHPDYDITALVRSKEKGEVVRSKYQDIRLVYGTLDDFDLLADEASKADVTCHLANCEHEAGAKAIAEGLSRNTAGYAIHLSGADNICYLDLNTETYGKAGDRVFNDLTDLEEILAPSNKAPHREVDVAILEAAKKGGKTAIVCPPTIYGPGRGPGNKRSIQVPELASRTLQRGKAITVKGGDNIWNSVHIHDLAKLFLLLVEAAVEGGGQADWGVNGFYFAENGHFSWRAVAESIAKAANARGLLKSTDLDNLSVEEADAVWDYGSFFWGTNSRSRAVRARDVLGWEPVAAGIFEDIPDTVEGEAATLGLV
ncbi:hypothetical protein EDB80DRAFT_740382 [Ilyonectria destructans]|uniref:NAD-dependent epimerase/dehydratase domain-containing protein n=1 Tax=Dactylonectria estremocensis TaxID=1079267 RepID=A0A9P9I7E9_9HYPO|nr:hypothetical protein EDB80DRAFT_740382 [Ilyonectria destructans]KAH7109385.1 hypothetical protein B0J13DRAFT_600633 [Dactylonectria estremocensis]